MVEFDIVVLERHPGGDVELDARLDIGGLRGYHVLASGGKIALVLNELENGGGAERELLLIGIDGLLFQDALLDGRLILRAGFLKSDDSVLNVDADLIDLALNLELVLAKVEGRGSHVGLSGAIAERNSKVQADGVVGKIPAEQLSQDIAITADEVRVGDGWILNQASCGVNGGRPYHGILRPGQGVVPYISDEAQGWQKGVFCSFQKNSRVVDLYAALSQVGTVVDGSGNEVLHWLDRFDLGDADGIGSHHAGFGDGGIGQTVAAQGAFQYRFKLENGALGLDERLLIGSQLGFGTHHFDRRQGADLDLFLIVPVQFL